MLGKVFRSISVTGGRLFISPRVGPWSSGLGHELGCPGTEADVPGLAVACRPA